MLIQAQVMVVECTIAQNEEGSTFPLVTFQCEDRDKFPSRYGTGVVPPEICLSMDIILFGNYNVEFDTDATSKHILWFTKFTPERLPNGEIIQSFFSKVVDGSSCIPYECLALLSRLSSSTEDDHQNQSEEET